MGVSPVPAVSNGMIDQVALIGNAVIDNVISSGVTDAGLRLNVTNTSDGLGLSLRGNNYFKFSGSQLFVSRGVTRLRQRNRNAEHGP